MTAFDYDAIAVQASPEQLASIIGAKKDKGGNFHCPGPDHENGDRRASLSINRKDGRTVALCHGCGLTGSPVQVVAELWSVTHSEAAERLASHIGITTTVTSYGLGEIDTTYEYTDEQGEHLFEVVRFKSKEFKQRRKQGPGWSWKLDGVRRVLYRLPELLAGVEAGRQIFLCEGEKDVANVTALGFVATTNSAGSMKWRPEYSETLEGARVVILPDNDEPGRSHAHDVAGKLHGIAAEVKVLELPELPKKGDVSDWIDAGGTAEQLKALVLAAPLWGPENSPPTETFASTESDEHLTDLGNAQRFVRLHGERVRYVRDWGMWLVWDGMRWKKDRTGEVERLAKATVKAIHEETLELKDRSRAEAMSKHGYRSESESRLNSMISLARTEDGIPLLAEQLDADPWLLNVLNGTLYLRTGELLPHDPERLITKLAPVEYDPDARAPKWDAFLSRIMDSDDLVSFLQRAIGYSMTGLTQEHVLIFLYGLGANGKSTLLNTLLAIFGDYGLQAEPGLLLQQRIDSHPTGVAALKGAHLVVSSEVQGGRHMAESRVKHLTGGDRITARYMRQDFFEFEPTHTLWLMANHRPTIKGTDSAIWRRIRLVPFSVTIPPKEWDLELGEKLWAEAPGILAWAARGCLEWQERGLDAPAEVRAATKAYRDAMDVLGGFISEHCVVEDGAETDAKDLYGRYKDWAEVSGERRLGKNQFGTQLQERGFESYKHPRHRRIVYRGIGLNVGSEATRSNEDVTPLENARVETNVNVASRCFAPADDDDYERVEREAIQTEAEFN